MSANEKFVRMCVCDIGIAEQYKVCCSFIIDNRVILVISFLVLN